MAGSFTDSRLSGLVERLRQARWRSAYATAVNLVAASVLITLGVFCLLQLAHNLLGTLAPSVAFAGQLVPGWLSTLRPSPFPQHVLLAAGAGLVAVAVVPVIAVLRLPAIAVMARAADRRFGMDECLSTALEVSYAPARWPGLVARALLPYAESRSEAVEPRRLVPIRVPRIAAGIPILLGVATLATFAPPPPLLFDAYQALLAVTSGRMMSEAQTQEQQEQRERTAANLRVIAAILKQDGEARADPAIQAIANALNRLGKDVADNTDMGGEALAQELGRLLSLARDAYARVGEAGTSRNLARLIAGLNELAPNRPTGAYQDMPTRPATGQAREETPKEDNPLVGLLTTREYAGIDDFADLVTPGIVLGDPRRDRARGGDGPADAAGAGDQAMLAAGDEYGPEGPNAGGAAAGIMIGGADGAGPGDYAGVGTQNLFGNAGAPGASIEFAGDMLLETPGFRGGRRILLSLAPPVELRVPAVNAPGNVGGWRTIPEERVTRTDLPAPARDAVSRYFDALRLGAKN